MIAFFSEHGATLKQMHPTTSSAVAREGYDGSAVAHTASGGLKQEALKLALSVEEVPLEVPLKIALRRAVLGREAVAAERSPQRRHRCSPLRLEASDGSTGRAP